MKAILHKQVKSINSDKRHMDMEDELNISDSSDISNFTDNKVFKGAIKNSSGVSTSIKTDRKTQAQEMKKESACENSHNKNNPNNEENGLPSNKTNFEILLKDNGPISFRGPLHNDIQINSVRHKEILLRSEKECSENNQHDSVNNKIENIINRLSKNDCFQEHNFPNQIKVDESTKCVDIKTPKNLDIDYKNFGHNKDNDEIDEDIEDYKIFRSYSLNRLDSRARNREKKFKPPFASNKLKNSSCNKIKCTLSKIEKRVAIFVSDNHMIFSLPAYLVSDTLQPGNSYEISFNQLSSVNAKMSEIIRIQKKLVG